MTRRRKLIGLGVVAAVTVLTAGTLTVVAWAGPPSSEAVQYSAPFVCGWLPPVPPDLDQHLKPGDYATSISIDNHTGTNVFGSKRVHLQYRMGTPPPPVVPSVNLSVVKNRVLEIDCIDIWGMAGVPPGSFIKGAVHIGLGQQLPVAATYAVQTHTDPNIGPDPGAGISIDVEHIPPLTGVTGPTG